jgi:lysozyme
MEQGIDVAWPQGAHFPWAAEAGKIQFGMCKATEGATLLDPDFAANWNGMWEMDRMMPRFAYHVFDFETSPADQAEFCVTTVKAHGLLPGDNLVLDVSDGLTFDLAPEVLAARGVAFLHAANALAPGHRVLVYTDVSFAEAGGCAGMGAWFLWVAEYGVSAPRVPAPWTAWTFWQRSDDGLDLDVFTGTREQLLAFTRMPDKR